MKRINLIGYTLVVLMIGAMIGGAINAWAFSSTARVQMGGKQAGLTYVSEKVLLLQVYNPQQIDSVLREGPNQRRIILK